MKKIYISFIACIRIISLSVLFLLYCINGKTQDTIKISIRDTSLRDSIEYVPGDNDYNMVLAAEKGDEKGVLKFLNMGADINARTGNGVTPLMYASQNGHLTVVKMLILNGADVNAVPDNEVSAIIGASLFNQVDVVELLIQNRAEINAGDKDNITSLIYAAAYDYFILADMLIYYEADIFLKDNDGTDPLIIAAMNGNIDIVDLLIRKGANVNSADNKNFTPIMVAAQNGHIDIVELFFEEGANINVCNINGFSAFALAIKNGHSDIVKFFIENGADVNEKISKSINLLTLATKNNKKYIKDLLKENGARFNFYPNFTKLSMVLLDMNWNFDDFMCGGKLGIQESKYNIECNLGFNTRPFPIRILIRKENNLYYQFWERRSFFYLDFEKKINIYKFSESTQIGLFLGVKEIYSFGSYRGSNIKINSKFVFVPQMGLYWRNNAIALKLNYEHLDFSVHKISAHRINFTVSLLINIDKYLKSNKEVHWL